MNFKEVYSKYFLQASVLHKLIIVNVFVFVLFSVLGTLSFLLKIDLSFIENWFAFTHDLFGYMVKPWSLVTYSFLHDGLGHLFFNMLLLYLFGEVFLNIHNGRRFLNVYFLGVIFGALLFMVAYSLFPVFEEVNRSTMKGASAGVSAVMVAAAIQSPNYSFRLLFIPVNIKIWWIVGALLLRDVISIQYGNAGGHFSHLGGALIGYLYMVQLQKGNDIGKPVESFMDWAVSLTKPKEKTVLKTVHKAKKTKKNSSSNASSIKKTTLSRQTKTPTQAQIDAILDKISKSGYESLSKSEKDFLFKAGKN